MNRNWTENFDYYYIVLSNQVHLNSSTGWLTMWFAKWLLFCCFWVSPCSPSESGHLTYHTHQRYKSTLDCVFAKIFEEIHPGSCGVHGLLYFHFPPGISIHLLSLFDCVFQHVASYMMTKGWFENHWIYFFLFMIFTKYMAHSVYLKKYFQDIRFNSWVLIFFKFWHYTYVLLIIIF